MNDNELIFTPIDEIELVDAHIFKLVKSRRSKPDGVQADFSLVKAPDWANVIVIIKDSMGRDCFLMIRQFRHGIGKLIWEFPGGMVDPGETAHEAAIRELREETGYFARSLVLLGEANPNPAFMTNRVHTFLAEGAEKRYELDTDEHELVRSELLPVEDVLQKMGTGDFDHGIMLMALYWLKKHKGWL